MKKSFIFLALCVLISACSSTNTQIYQPLTLSVGLAPLMQPLEETELMAGYFPENRLLANEAQVSMLNEEIITQIRQFEASVSVLEPIAEEILLPRIDENETKGILAYWVEFGKYHEVDVLLVPYLFYYSDKNHTTESNLNALMLDFYLIDTRDEGLLLSRSHFAEEEKLSSDDMGMVAFSERMADVSINAMISDAVEIMSEEFSL